MPNEAVNLTRGVARLEPLETMGVPLLRSPRRSSADKESTRGGPACFKLGA